MQKMNEGLNELAELHGLRPKEYAYNARRAAKKIKEAAVLLGIDKEHDQAWRWGVVLATAIEGYASEIEKLKE